LDRVKIISRFTCESLILLQIYWIFGLSPSSSILENRNTTLYFIFSRIPEDGEIPKNSVILSTEPLKSNFIFLLLLCEGLSLSFGFALDECELVIGSHVEFTSGCATVFF
jgi:hypothetical protein